MPRPASTRSSKRKAAASDEPQPEPRSTRSRRNTRLEPLNVVNDVTPAPRATGKRRKTEAKSVSDPFAKEDALAWFKTLCDKEPNEKNISRISPTGLLQLAKEIDRDVGDVVFLLLAWKMDAQEMGYYSEEEWMKGMTALQIDCPAKLSAQWDSLEKSLEKTETFRTVYRFAYDYTKGKEGYCRLLDIKIAQELIRLFLGVKWPICEDFFQYLDSASVKALNRDQYNNVLEFSLMVQNDCSGYDENGAWPVLLDNFVTFMRNKKAKELETSTQEPETPQSS